MSDQNVVHSKLPNTFRHVVRLGCCVWIGSIRTGWGAGMAPIMAIAAARLCSRICSTVPQASVSPASQASMSACISGEGGFGWGSSQAARANIKIKNLRMKIPPSGILAGFSANVTVLAAQEATQ